MQIVEFLLMVFSDTTAMNAFAVQSGRRLDPGGRCVMKEILGTHRDRVHAYLESGDLAGAKAQIRRFLKPLRARRAASAEVRELKWKAEDCMDCKVVQTPSFQSCQVDPHSWRRPQGAPVEE